MRRKSRRGPIPRSTNGVCPPLIVFLLTTDSIIPERCGRMFSGVLLVAATQNANTSQIAIIRKIHTIVIKYFLSASLFIPFISFTFKTRYTPSKLFLTFATSSVNSGVLFISIVLGRGRFISTTAESLPGCGESTHTLSDKKTDS